MIQIGVQQGEGSVLVERGAEIACTEAEGQGEREWKHHMNSYSWWINAYTIDSASLAAGSAVCKPGAQSRLSWV